MINAATTSTTTADSSKQHMPQIYDEVCVCVSVSLSIIPTSMSPHQLYVCVKATATDHVVSRSVVCFVLQL
jgi:hypothetical protein